MATKTTKPKAEAGAKTRSRIRLSQTEVNKLKPVSKVTRIWDSVVLGFYVRISPGKRAKKVYCVTFQRPDGKKINIKIGDCTSMTFEDASRKAYALRTMYENKEDLLAQPTEKPTEKPTARDLNALVEVWRASYKSKLKPKSQESYESLIKKVILPELGHREAKTLTYSDINKLHTKESTQHKTNANRAIAVLSRLLSIAEKEGWMPRGSNPCADIEKNAETPRSQIFSAAAFAQLETSMLMLIEQQKLDASARDLVLFLAFSGLRTSEALGLQWQDVDVAANSMRFRNHKTSRAAGPKALPLNTHLKEILKRRQVGNDSTYVWPSLRLGPADPDEPESTPKDAPLVGLARMWKRICENGGASLAEVTPHDLRRSFMSTCTELGNTPAIGDILLGHSLGKIRDTYVNLQPDGILAITSQMTADWIASAVRGESPKIGQKVKAAKRPKAKAETI
ncbi:MAG: integrase family protein [Holophagaceae bacterium]|nr:integrase family protein [Holophagaceae bacterium]